MLEDGLRLIDQLLPLPSGWTARVGLPVLAVVLFLGVNLILRAAPALDHVVRPVGRGVFLGLGLLLVFPEYLLTTALRRMGRRPPVAFYLYGEGVENVVRAGCRISRAGLTGLTGDRVARQFLAALLVGLSIVVSNGGACDDSAPNCRSPMAVWWQEVTGAEDTADPPRKPAPSRSPRPPARR